VKPGILHSTNQKRKLRLDTIRSGKTGLYWLRLSVLLIAGDQLTKYLVACYLGYAESLYLFPFLNLTLAHNRGAAFSFMAGTGQIAVWLFILSALVISLFLCLWMYRLPFKNVWLGISLALILGGAIGNLLDRILYGYVIDFIHFHIGDWSFPIFNMADTVITFGAVMLLIDIFDKK
jgi:signal peptidase II